MVTNNQQSRLVIPDQSAVTVTYPDMAGSGGMITRRLGSRIVISTLPISYSVRDVTKRAYTPLDYLADGDPKVLPWYYRAVTEYTIPEAPNQGQGPEGWSALQVFDYVQLIENAQGLMGITDERPLSWDSVWKSGAELALNFLQGSKPWGRFPMDGSYRDGVGMTLVESLDQITPELIQRLQAERTAALQDVVRAADAIYGNVNRRHEILEGHRVAARILGVARAYADENVQTKRCPSCQTAIAINALACKHCSTQLLPFWKQLVQDGYYKLEEVKGNDYMIWDRLSRVMPTPAKTTRAAKSANKPEDNPDPAAPPAEGGGLESV